MSTPHTLGTAGHVDHGKTALVRALTGVDTDRLEEERRRGISIVLGYAELDLGDGDALSVVDVPGHERFVRTMIGGATGIDLALVCVAADDGVMPQTVEHLAILELLGVERGVVALTKADLVDAEALELARLDVAEALTGHPLAEAPVIPVSARTGAGLDDLRAALRAAATDLPARPSQGRARLPIDRVFTLHGIGTVVTGTLWSGRLNVDDEVRIAPTDRGARIRSLEMHGRAVDEAAAGGRVAVALSGVDRDEVRVGETLWTQAPATASYRLDVLAEVIAGTDGLRRGERVEIVHGTSIRTARAVVLDGDALPADSRGFVQIRLEEPLAALRSDRLIIRRLAPPGTIAGATVIDPRPRRHGGTAADVERLRLLSEGDDDSVALAALGGGPRRHADLVDDGLLDTDAARRALERLAEDGRAIALVDDWWMATTDFAVLRERVTSIVGERARTHRMDPVVPVDDLLPVTRARPALLSRLETDGVLIPEGAGARAPGATASVDLGQADRALEPVEAAPFATHRQSDVVAALPLPEGDAWTLIGALEEHGRIVRLPQGLLVSAEAYAEAVRIVREVCAQFERITLAQLRDTTDSSRKVSQALLERMDADGITRRVGDERILRRGARPDGN